jgi:hypothetical protein
MKKILFTSVIIMTSFVLFSFAGKQQQFTYNVLENSSTVLATEVSSFQEHEDHHNTSDKQVFFKRIRYWDAFSGTADINEMENVLNRN